MLKFLLIDFFRRTNVVLNYYKYKSLSKSSFEALQKNQQKKLLIFLKLLKENSAFSSYFENIVEKDIQSDPKKVFQILPITDKNFIRRNFGVIFNQEKGNYEKNYTGGSTGTPFKYILDKVTISKTRAFNYYLWNRFTGYKLGDKILVVGGSSLGSNKNIKKKVYNFLQNKEFIPGDLVKSDSSVNHINTLLKGNYKIIYGYPSSILSYVNLAKKKGLTFEKNIKGVVTTSEMLFDKDKLIIEDFFSTKVLNIYGANDGGIISGSIDNENFIYNGLDCFVEEHSSPESNETELLLTNLNSRVFPFARYKVGDIGFVVHDSPLGPFVIKNIKGRTRDFFKNKKGDIFHGSLINKILKDIKGIEKYQLVQNKDYSILFYIQTRDIDTFKTISNKVRSKLINLISDESISVIVKHRNTFEVTGSNKLKLIISDVA